MADLEIRNSGVGTAAAKVSTTQIEGFTLRTQAKDL